MIEIGARSCRRAPDEQAFAFAVLPMQSGQSPIFSFILSALPERTSAFGKGGGSVERRL